MVSVAIVVADFRKEMTEKMLWFAEKKARELGAEILAVVRVPGAFETPLAAKKILEKGEADAVVVLAVVLQGGTEHDVMVAENAFRKIADLSLEFGKPVCSGIIGPRVSKKQAEARLKEYAEHAAKAAVEMAKLKI
ncbi:MAG: 6,7-dimethyl-8-ribityllumazine synthase [Candidatus Diapherotrites archaeon]|nr:6,7-dimethyl-8-ribityllumazine synthase [Candidatus Diapherotrites archaeon]